TERLQHGEKTRETRLCNLMQNGDRSFARVLPRNRVLELQQATLAIHLVPLEHCVQRIEERLIILQSGDAMLHLLVEEQRVEQADGRAVQHPSRKLQRERKLGRA